LNGLTTTAGRPTTRINFTGTLNTNDAASAPHEVTGVTVIDAAQGSQTIRVRFTNNGVATPSSWLVQALEAAGGPIGRGETRFSTDGTPLAGFNSLIFSLQPAGVAASQVEFFFGDAGSRSGVQSLSTSSSAVQVGSQDGLAVGALVSTTFDERGVLKLTYSNGQTVDSQRLALASFSFLQGLEVVDGGLVRKTDESDRVLGHASDGPFGKVAPGKIELANVDLAREFSDLIISQRGFQASSEVISAANEMIQQLFDIKTQR